MRKLWRPWPGILLVSFALWGPLHPAPPGEGAYAIRAGRIVPVAGDMFRDGIVLIRNGKIEKIGAGLAVPEGYTLIDASGGWLFPGFVDTHSHTGGEGIGDLNDSIHPLNPGLRILDTIAFDTPELQRAVAAGVTTINHIPGSASNISGTGVVMKTAGDDPNDMVLRFPGVFKTAQAGNPERPHSGEIGAGRMGMNWHLREYLNDVKAHHERWNAFEAGKTGTRPEKDIRFEHSRGIFEGTLPVVVHCAWYQPVLAALGMYHDEFGIPGVIITHGEFGAYRTAPAFAERNVHFDCGPRLYDFENGSFHGIINAYMKGGVKNVSINTDSVGGGQEMLVLQAAMAVRLGLDEQLALEGITINSARALGLAHRIGSIEPGKDADLVVWSGNPFDVRNRVLLVLINGRVVYDIAKDGQRY